MTAHHFTKPVIFHMVLLSALCLAAESQAQQEGAIKVNEIELEELYSPGYNVDNLTTRKADDRLRWVRVTAEYQAFAQRGWLDSLTLRWHVLLMGGETSRILMHETVSYRDVKADRRTEHYAVLYIRPRSIRRYYDEDGNISPRDIAV